MSAGSHLQADRDAGEGQSSLERHARAGMSLRRSAASGGARVHTGVGPLLRAGKVSAVRGGNLSPVVDALGEENAEGDRELVAGDESTTVQVIRRRAAGNAPDLGRRALGLRASERGRPLALSCLVEWHCARSAHPNATGETDRASRAVEVSEARYTCARTWPTDRPAITRPAYMPARL